MTDRLHAPVVWAIGEEALLSMLRRVAAGEDPDAVYAEAFANANGQRVDPPE